MQDQALRPGRQNDNMRQVTPHRQKMLTRKQAEYLAFAIEKGLVQSAEELHRRVRSER